MSEEYSDSHLREILTRTRRVAVVGVSMNPVRPSYYVARYLSLKRYEVVPVNPGHAGERLFGQTVVAGLRTVWMQIGVENAEAAALARARGVDVVMNRCPKIEYQRLFGELRMGGFNTGVISSKL